MEDRMDRSGFLKGEMFGLSLKEKVEAYEAE